MRIIDADKLENDIVENITVKAVSRMLAITQGQPTVKAIPIEWIEKWFSQFYGEQGLEWNRCKRFMLKDWEKENGQND